jgi:hypothetical protein
MSDQKPPPELDAIVDLVLAYRPKAKTDSAKKRKKKIKEFVKKASKEPTSEPEQH